jgi:putative DNA primase/helicase
MVVNKKQEPSSPDFNDEFIHYGLDKFTVRLKKRLNDAAEALKQSNNEQQTLSEQAPIDDNIPDYIDNRGWQMDFLKSRGEPKGCAQNAFLIFENDEHWQGVFAENVFTGTIDILRETPIPEIEVGELSDQHVSMIHVWIEKTYGFIVQDAAMKKALITISAKNRFHPVKDYLNDLPEWDGAMRCSLWLKMALGAEKEPDEYLAATGEKFLIGAVRRIMNSPEPTKIDNMLVFEGLQGGGKSSLIEALFTPWHGDTPLPLGDKDSYINIRGSWGYEMAEMDSFNKATVTTAKSFLSSHTDNYRPPFGTKNMKYPRQTVLIGSVNHSEYLTDSSGNRRYWPIWGYKVDLQWLKDNREQLWAEALYLAKEGKPHWLDIKEEPKLVEMIEYEQSLREHPDAFVAKLHAWMLHEKNLLLEHYSSNDLLQNVFEMDIRSVNKSHEMKLSNAMQKLGWTRQRKRVEGHHTARPYLYITPKWAKDRSDRRKAPKQKEAAF